MIISIALMISLTANIELYIRLEEATAEKNQIELEYSYSMEMLGGFLSNEAESDDQLKELLDTRKNLGTI